MQSIRIKTGVVIEVNDKGDTVTAHIEDGEFITNFYELTEYMKNPKVDLHEGQTKQEALDAMMNYSRTCVEKIDKLFGEGSSKKMFDGCTLPSPYMLATLMEQLVPIFEKYQKQRDESISERYNVNRAGGTNV